MEDEVEEDPNDPMSASPKPQVAAKGGAKKKAKAKARSVVKQFCGNKHVVVVVVVVRKKNSCLMCFLFVVCSYMFEFT